MINLEYLIILLLLGIVFFQWKNQKRIKAEEYLNNYVIQDEFKKTIALGLYQRFCNDSEEKQYSSTFLKSNPLEFENFIADVLKYRYGLESYVTKSTGDFGVDVEHGIGEGKVIGQVKCYLKDIGYEPIAIIHSNMVKQKASKGYVVSTSGFTENARMYAEGLNIDLISGTDLVDMWINFKNPIVNTYEYKEIKSDASKNVSM